MCKTTFPVLLFENNNTLLDIIKHLGSGLHLVGFSGDTNNGFSGDIKNVFSDNNNDVIFFNCHWTKKFYYVYMTALPTTYITMWVVCLYFFF